MTTSFTDGHTCCLVSRKFFVFALLHVCVVCTLFSRRFSVDAASDFYYDHWQCNHYLSPEFFTVRSVPGKLLEIHVRDNIQVA